MEPRIIEPTLNKGRKDIYFWIFFFLCIIISTLITAYTTVWALRVILGVFLVVFLPGYLLINSLWPVGNVINPLWRLGLILPSSIALDTGLLLLINYFGVYQYQTSVLFIGLVDCILLTIFAWRVKPGRIRDISIFTRVNNLQQSLSVIRWQRGFFLPVMALLLLFFTILYAVLTPPKLTYTTEFYVTTEDGRLVTEPTADELLQQGLKVGVGNYEGKPLSYTIFITASSDTADELLLGSMIFSLKNGSKEEKSFTINQLPDKTRRINLYLYVVTDNQDTYPYRTLSIMTNNGK